MICTCTCGCPGLCEDDWMRCLFCRTYHIPGYQANHEESLDVYLDPGAP